MNPSWESIAEEFGQNSGYVGELYSLYKKDKSLVGAHWANLFENLEALGGGNGSAPGHLRANSNGTAGVGTEKSDDSHRSVDADYLSLVQRTARFIFVHRNFGHYRARVNPLSKGVVELPSRGSLRPESYHFTSADMSKVVPTENFGDNDQMPLGELVEALSRCYLGSVGFEYWHVELDEEREWLRERIEGGYLERAVNSEKAQSRLRKLIQAEQLEAGLHRKYIGAKRFSLEGGETLIPMLSALFDRAADQGVSEAVLGMAHRGRLNVLVNVCGKRLAELFGEFEDSTIASTVGAGDVKYHSGYEGNVELSQGGRLPIRLASNPSHLEFVTPVVVGIARGSQEARYEGDPGKVLPVILHGDAAFIGQGVVAETLNFSQINGYSSGGAVHVVINNQLGFTTTPDESRSTPYCTAFAKGMDLPIFHVNCEDVDRACAVMELALEYRQRFQRDVVIDLFCYRKYGHNEGDDPTFTQPLLYSEIKSKSSISEQYREQLRRRGDIDDEFYESFLKSYKEFFDDIHEEASQMQAGGACALRGKLECQVTPKPVTLEVLDEIADNLLRYPEGFSPHPKLARLLEKRVRAFQDGRGIEWGLAEALAFGTILREGVPVRLSGQDSVRGTFSQRHFGLDHHTQEASDPRANADVYVPLDNLAGGASFEIYNSSLSEAAVVGFEYGYATEYPEKLVIWEAQFGDFGNGAQVIIDQFLASSESKWNELCGLVMLLPHGYEGQGPEHSSARLERYLQLCAESNISVAYPSDSAQYFHLLRRQAFLEMKRPLVVMTPKSLLRLPDAMSLADSMVSGHFSSVILSDHRRDESQGRPLLFCSGKVYYDLFRAIKEEQLEEFSVARIEQLYPFPEKEVQSLLEDLKPSGVAWLQEEPQNMGAWQFIEPLLRNLTQRTPRYCGRAASATTATGSPKFHFREQRELIGKALDFLKGSYT